MFTGRIVGLEEHLITTDVRSAWLARLSPPQAARPATS